MKQALLRLLARLGLLAPTFRGYEWLRARRRPRAPEIVPADGLPLPPPRLIVLVAGTPDAAWFLESGRRGADSIRDALARAGAPIEEARSILDFGCGCGRVVRYWANLEGRVSGSDVQRRAIDWCRANLPFARFETNGLAPPLAFADGSFDVVYALSVLTHLPEPLQFAWIDELARVTERDGHVIVTTHGERYLDQLDDDERARFDRGELVVRRPEVAGTNLCATFHPPSWVREHLIPRGFEEVAFVAEGAKGNPNQDLFLLRRAA